MPAEQANFDVAAADVLTSAKVSLNDAGFSWSNVGKVVYDAVDDLMREAADKLLGKTGAEKKAQVMAYVRALLVWAVPKLPLPWFLMWLKLPVVSETLLAILEKLLGGLIEGNYTKNVEKFSV